MKSFCKIVGHPRVGWLNRHQGSSGCRLWLFQSQGVRRPLCRCPSGEGEGLGLRDVPPFSFQLHRRCHRANVPRTKDRKLGFASPWGFARKWLLYCRIHSGGDNDWKRLVLLRLFRSRGLAMMKFERAKSRNGHRRTRNLLARPPGGKGHKISCDCRTVSKPARSQHVGNILAGEPVLIEHGDCQV